jgi:cellobiose-specific phosphotransferase system component IIB
MKAKINAGFSTKLMATQYQPVESNDSIEMEIEFENEAELIQKYEHYQDIVRAKVIKNVFKGIDEIRQELYDREHVKE